MATGDLKNNLRKLQTEIKLMRYPETVDIKGLTQGDVKAFMPILHWAFTSYSTTLAEEIAAKDIVLFAKTDAGFMESIYKVLRDMFSYKPMVNKDQFFTSQFAERKIIMCTQVLQHIQRRSRTKPPTRPLFKPNMSMDNIAKPPLGRARPKSAVTEKSEGKSSSMARPTSTTGAPRTRQTVNRSSSLRSTLPGPNKPQVVKEVVNPNQSCDSLLSLSVPSIARVKPQSVEVITMQTVQGASRTNGPPGGSIMGFAEPNTGVGEGDRNSLMNMISELKEQLEQKCKFLESFERRMRHMEAMFDMRNSAPTTPTPTSDDQRRWADIDARMKLLENRVLIIESKQSGMHAVDGDKLKVQSPTNNSPVTPGKVGTFVSVESFINGESKVRKMAREAEAKFRSRSLEDDAEKFSPIIKEPTVETALNKSDEELFTMIPDPEPGNSSTPAKSHALEDSINLKCVDTPIQDQAHRIQHLMQSTQSMLMPGQTKIPADEVSRHDVD